MIPEKTETIIEQLRCSTSHIVIMEFRGEPLTYINVKNQMQAIGSLALAKAKILARIDDKTEETR